MLIGGDGDGAPPTAPKAALARPAGLRGHGGPPSEAHLSKRPPDSRLSGVHDSGTRSAADTAFATSLGLGRYGRGWGRREGT
eukprot:9468683-Pyramimonas_sp.AAC.1